MSAPGPQDLERALRTHRAGRLEEAEALYRDLLQATPEDAQLRHLLGVAAAQQGRPAEAATLISQAIERDPEDPQFHFNLGNALAELDDLEPAIASYERALTLDRRYVDARVNRGKALQRLGRLDKAGESHRDALMLKPDHFEALINLGSICLIQGEPATALATFERAVAACGTAPVSLPDLAEAHLGRGRALAVAERPEEALAAFEQALVHQPDMAVAYWELGNLFQARGQLASAIERYKRALAYKPDSAEAYVGLSCCYARLGRKQDAAAATRMAIRHSPLRTIRSRGREEGRILVLQSMENEVFTGTGKKLTSFNTTNAISHLDGGRLTVHRVYVGENFLDHVVPELPPFDVVFNAITEADNCECSLETAKRFVDGVSVPVINHPAQVKRTSRDENYRRLHRIPGLVFPKTVKVSFGAFPMQQFEQLMATEGFDYPVIVRRAATHGGKTMVKIDRPSDFENNAAKFSNEIYYIIKFKDYSIDVGIFRKMRCFFINNAIVSNHMFAGTDWNVHEKAFFDWIEGDSSFEELQSHREHSVRFFRDPTGYLGHSAYNALENVAHQLELDFLGVDFTLLEDGRLLVFEANSAMAFGRVPEVGSMLSAKRNPEASPNNEDVLRCITNNNKKIATQLNNLLISRITESRKTGIPA